jgi:serine/threonine protein kinase
MSKKGSVSQEGAVSQEGQVSQEGARVLLCRGNRTEVLSVIRDGRQIVEKRLQSFADVSAERIALYREAVVQKAAQGPGVVAIADDRIPSAANLEHFLESPQEANSIFREFVDGYTIRELIEKPQLLQNEHLPEKTRSSDAPDRSAEERCAQWIHSLALTLHRVHNLRDAEGASLGLVHRDVTPGNVLIERSVLECIPGENGVWLNDFGLARVKAWGPLLPEETLQGAPRYLTPELRAGQTPQATSDVYQAALVLCGLLCALEHRPVASLFQSTHSLASAEPSDYARRLLERWKADVALDTCPKNRPSALEFAALLASSAAP